LKTNLASLNSRQEEESSIEEVHRGCDKVDAQPQTFILRLQEKSARHITVSVVHQWIRACVRFIQKDDISTKERRLFLETLELLSLPFLSSDSHVFEAVMPSKHAGTFPAQSTMIDSFGLKIAWTRDGIKGETGTEEDMDASKPGVELIPTEVEVELEEEEATVDTTY